MAGPRCGARGVGQRLGQEPGRPRPHPVGHRGLGCPGAAGLVPHRGGHRVGGHRPGPGPRRARPPARPRRADLDGRLRDRVHLAVGAARPPARRAEDRPGVRPARTGVPGGRRHRRHHLRPRAPPRSGGGGRGGGGRGHRVPDGGPRCRRAPGLPPGPSRCPRPSCSTGCARARTARTVRVPGLRRPRAGRVPPRRSASGRRRSRRACTPGSWPRSHGSAGACR